MKIISKEFLGYLLNDEIREISPEVQDKVWFLRGTDTLHSFISLNDLANICKDYSVSIDEIIWSTRDSDQGEAQLYNNTFFYGKTEQQAIIEAAEYLWTEH